MQKTLTVIMAWFVTLFSGGTHAKPPVTPSQPATVMVSVAPSTATSADTSITANQKVYSDAELLAMADNKYANGKVPLGDNKYVTTAAKKGYIYLCHTMAGNGGGAGVDGPWIQGSSWNYLNKVSVHGSVSWPNATFSNTVSGESRTLAGNDLPVGYTTGTFPIQSSDAAYAYDRNPNKISAQTLKDVVSAHPSYSNSPYCMSGEVGVMLSGVALFDGFDAEMRDAPAHELQDSCDGHPEKDGEYHYHSLSKCFKDISVKTVLGYALDGFPITGPMVAQNKYLTTEDLDECHGITSEIVQDGKKTVTYHYVMTQDFPYSASCFRGKPIQPYRPGVGGSQQNQQQGTQAQQGQGNMQQGLGQTGQQPPQEAVAACNGKSQGSSCSFTTPRGTLSGTCQTPPNSSLACVPNK